MIATFQSPLSRIVQYSACDSSLCSLVGSLFAPIIHQNNDYNVSVEVKDKVVVNNVNDGDFIHSSK